MSNAPLQPLTQCCRQLLGAGLLLLWGCSSGQSGGEIGQSDAPFGLNDTPELAFVAAGCQESHREDIPLTDKRLGFSAQDALNLALGNHNATLSYGNNEQSQLQLAVSSSASQATLVQSQPATAKAISRISCPSRLEINIEINISSSDGRFAESTAATLLALQTGSSGTFIRIPDNQVQGSFMASDFVNSQAPHTVIFDVVFEANQSNGRLLTIGQSNGQNSNQTDNPGQWQ